MSTHNVVENEYEQERSELYPLLVKDFDVLIIQEAFDLLNPFFNNFIRLLKNAGFKYMVKSQDPQFSEISIYDAGLLIVSKYPIVAHDILYFQNGVEKDIFIKKGLLYAQVKINDKYLHIFDLHLQADYLSSTQEMQNHCHINKINQIYETRKFIEKQIKNHFRENDIGVLAGDFNVDARADSEKINLQHLKKHLNVDKIFQNFAELKYHILTDNNKIFNLRDLMKEKIQEENLKEYPITYGDFYVDENGKEQPLDTVLTDPAEILKKEYLDYIYIIEQKNKKQNFKYVQKSLKVEKFFIKDRKFTQISDHYGLSIEIN